MTFYYDNLMLTPLDLGPHPIFHHRITTAMKEAPHRGFRIVQKKYDGPTEGVDSFGFQVEFVYTVLDDFDDFALPLAPAYFWSPADAAAAIDFYLWAKTKFPQKKWATSPAHEYNMMTLLRRRIPEVYEALHDMRKIMLDAADFGDNPAKELKARMDMLDSATHSWTRQDGF